MQPSADDNDWPKLLAKLGANVRWADKLAYTSSFTHESASWFHEYRDMHNVYATKHIWPANHNPWAEAIKITSEVRTSVGVIEQRISFLRQIAARFRQSHMSITYVYVTLDLLLGWGWRTRFKWKAEKQVYFKAGCATVSQLPAKELY